uniref:SH3-containing GRB2-like protein 3-interacting protein 1 n=1 Tax=Cryptocotyle lingua TaxID=66766 RepID=A0A7U0TI95_9TREM|nr:SH3-containing GRB2-like protein 3-interacting protein 1 [Cryptocotyle lingua]
METCLFAENFWGEKHAGFDILYQNLKLDSRSTSDLVDFLRESCSAEDAYSKSLWKLSKQTSSSITANAFKPCWSIIHQLTESMAQFHQSIAQAQLSLMKDVQKYLEEQQKRHKSVRESESSTQEVVHAFQVSAIHLQRAKEVYNSRLTEYQRITRNESVSTREQEKGEAKLKKALDEYRYSVEKYNNLRTQFVNKMHSSCAQFQEVESSHLDHMREFLHRYYGILATSGSTLNEFVTQFKQNLDQVTTDQLLQTFVKERGTGSDEPQCVALEDVEVASAFASPGADRVNASVGNSLGTRTLEALFGREPRAASALAVPPRELNPSHAQNVVPVIETELPNALMHWRQTGVWTNEILQLLGIETKATDGLSHTSLTDLNGEEPPVTNVPTSNGPYVSVPSKRREGFFRRRRNSLTQDPSLAGNGAGSNTTLGTPTDTTASPIQSSSSLSAFNIVAKRGLRRLGTPNSNGKEKLGSKQEVKADTPSGSEDWQSTATPLELPKDEEGYSIRPTDPWSEGAGDDHVELTNSDSGSDSEVDIVGRSFKGLKVKIRPVGEFAPGVTTLPVNSTVPTAIQKLPRVLNPPTSNRPHVPVLHDRRSARSGKRDGPTSPGLPAKLDKPVLGANLIHQLPTAPALPPPPGIASSGLTANVSRSQTVDDTSLVSWQEMDPSKPTPSRPKWSGHQTWSKVTTETPPNGHAPSHSLDLTTFDVLSPVESDRAPPVAFSRDDISSPAVDKPSDARRCASAVPPQVQPEDASSDGLPSLRNTDHSTWSAFDFDATNKSTNISGTAWPTHTNHIENFTSEPTTPTPPEPPLRTHSKFLSNADSVLSIPSLNAFPVHQSTTASVNSLQASLSPLGPLSVAAAFSETWRAHFLNGGGSSFSTITPPPVQSVSGELTLAFPTPAVKQLASAPAIGPLMLKLTHAFRLRDIQLKLEGATVTTQPSEDNSICPSSESTVAYLVAVPGSVVIRYLSEQLRQQISGGDKSDTPTSTPPYIKLDLLSYTVSFSACGQLPNISPPIHLCTYWRCEPTVTDFRLDYTTHWPIDNQNALSSARGDLRVHLSVDGGVARMQSLPLGFWFPDANRATWQIPLSQPTNTSATSPLPTSNVNTSGTVRAKFILTSGPGRPQPVALQFFREDCLASGVQLEIEGSLDYRLSLCKRRIIGDRYICDPPSHSPRFQLHPAHQPTKSVNQQPKPPSRIPLPHSGGLPQLPVKQLPSPPLTTDSAPNENSNP